MTTDEKRLQEKFVLYQLLQNRLEELKQQTAIIERRFLEIETTKYALNEVKNLKTDNEILIPLGSGCYTHGKITDSDKLLVDLGAGAFVNKTVVDAEQFFESKKQELSKASKDLQVEINNVVNSSNEIGLEIQKLAKEAKKEK